jgi:hypothetical protein
MGKKKIRECSTARPKALVACDASLLRLLREIIIVNSAKTRQKKSRCSLHIHSHISKQPSRRIFDERN